MRNFYGSGDMRKVFIISIIDSYAFEPHFEKKCFFVCENKDADQPCSNCTADQHLCFCFMEKTISPSLMLNLELQSSCAVEQAGRFVSDYRFSRYVEYFNYANKSSHACNDNCFNAHIIYCLRFC